MKRDGRSLPHDALETFRFAAVRFQREDVSVRVISMSFDVTPQAVYSWLRKSRLHGMSSLKSTKALGPVPKLNETQFSELLKLLRRPASEVGYATDLWSGPRIRHLIKHKFGLTYHPKHLPRFLRRLGLVLKKPERRALEQDPQAVKRWKEERLPEILNFARKTRALVFYADESLVSLIPYIGKTWTFPEARPEAFVSGKRGQHVGSTAAVNEQGRMCFELTRENERFTAKVFIRFIRKLRREHPGRRHVLIVDGAPIHKAKIVKAFAKENESWLRMERLPAYSPELNPSEKCWDYVKNKKMNASKAADKAALRAETSNSMRVLKRNRSKVASFFSARK